jgi:hypothetical protein
MNTEAFDEPLEVKVCDGEVVLIARRRPFSVSLTARAALKTGEALSDAAKLVLAD